MKNINKLIFTPLLKLTVTPNKRLNYVTVVLKLVEEITNT